MSDIDWIGRSGWTYGYFFLKDTSAAGIVPEPGNYAFVRQLANGNWTPIYFGIAENLRGRIPNHERLAEAVRLGATHIMGHTTPNEASRVAEEQDLIAYWNPPLNVHYRTTG
jgi:hypothetical protein